MAVCLKDVQLVLFTRYVNVVVLLADPDDSIALITELVSCSSLQMHLHIASPCLNNVLHNLTAVMSSWSLTYCCKQLHRRQSCCPAAGIAHLPESWHDTHGQLCIVLQRLSGVEYSAEDGNGYLQEGQNYA